MSIMEWKPTKEQPGRYSTMLKELAKIDGVSDTKRVTYKNIESARKNKVKFPEMIFCIDHQEIYCIRVEMKAGIKTLIFSQFEMPVDEYTKPISTIVDKSIEDYTARPESAGKYKNCEGGGWYSMANLYRLNGKYYTDAY